MRIPFTCAAIVTLLVLGCRIELPAASTASLSLRLPDGSSSSASLTNSQIDALHTWFRAHSSGWDPTLIDYVPNYEVHFTAQDGYPVTINCSAGFVVVNVPQGQFARSLSISETAELFGILRISHG
jgi:hypothetical protein